MGIKRRAAEWFDRRLLKYKWYNSFKSDYGFRTMAFAVGGTLINIAFACFNGVTALYYMSLWYGVFAGYYLVLALLRVGVFVAYRIVLCKSAGDEEKLFREK